jgi:hypothetical protein
MGRRSAEIIMSFTEGVDVIQLRSPSRLNQEEDTKQPKLSRSTPSEPMQFASPPQLLKSAHIHQTLEE